MVEDNTERVKAVAWEQCNDERMRYRARAIDGGPAWCVYDFKLDRPVPVDAMRTMTFDDVCEKLPTS